jgi:glutaredoxin
VKELLSREQVSFIVKNVDEDEAAYDELISLGFRVVPVTIIGGRAIKGCDVAAIADAIGLLRTRLPTDT